MSLEIIKALEPLLRKIVREELRRIHGDDIKHGFWKKRSRGGRYYYCRHPVTGKQMSTGCQTLDAAKLFLARLEREAARGSKQVESSGRLRGKGGVTARARHTVLARDLECCRYCGHAATTVDHLTPPSRGGTHRVSNLVACCGPCNSRKSSRTYDEARDELGMILRPEPA